MSLWDSRTREKVVLVGGEEIQIIPNGKFYDSARISAYVRLHATMVVGLVQGLPFHGFYVFNLREHAYHAIGSVALSECSDGGAIVDVWGVWQREGDRQLSGGLGGALFHLAQCVMADFKHT